MRKSTRSPRLTNRFGGDAEGEMFIADLDNGAVRIGFTGIGPFVSSHCEAFRTASYAAPFAKSQEEIEAIGTKALESLA
jgi:hypothetical protein